MMHYMAEKNAASAAPEQNKMGVMPIGRLLLSMGLPMVLSMLVQALYNIVDSLSSRGSAKRP